MSGPAAPLPRIAKAGPLMLTSEHAPTLDRYYFRISHENRAGPLLETFDEELALDTFSRWAAAQPY